MPLQELDYKVEYLPGNQKVAICLGTIPTWRQAV